MELESLESALESFQRGGDLYLGTPWLHNAIQSGSLEALQWMNAEAVDIDVRSAEGCTVLQACIECQSEDRKTRPKMLIDAGADLNSLGLMFQTALHRGALREDEVAMKMLLAAGVDRSVRSTIDGCDTAEEDARDQKEYAAADFIASYPQNSSPDEVGRERASSQ